MTESVPINPTNPPTTSNNSKLNSSPHLPMEGTGVETPKQSLQNKNWQTEWGERLMETGRQAGWIGMAAGGAAGFYFFGVGAIPGALIGTAMGVVSSLIISSIGVALLKAGGDTNVRYIHAQGLFLKMIYHF